MALIQKINLSKDDINVIINVLEQAEELSLWEDLTMNNQSDYFGNDMNRYFSPSCAPQARAKKLAQLFKWAGDLDGKKTICKMEFVSHCAEVYKSAHPIQEGVGVTEPEIEVEHGSEADNKGGH